MWMTVEIFCFIVVFYVASLASPQIGKKNPAGEVSGSAFQLGRKIAMVLNCRR
jgi:hypothetical protein